MNSTAWYSMLHSKGWITGRAIGAPPGSYTLKILFKNKEEWWIQNALLTKHPHVPVQVTENHLFYVQSHDNGSDTYIYRSWDDVEQITWQIRR